MALLKQSTVYNRTFLMVLSSDHISPATGKTVTVALSKAGAAFGAAAGAVTEIANGWYQVALTTADTATLGDLTVHCIAALCDNTDFADQVIAVNLADTVRLGLTALPSVAPAAAGGLPTVDANNAVKLQSGTGANQISLAAGLVTVGANNDKTGYALTQAFPANFAALAIDGSGHLTLVQAFPSNFAALAIDVSGRVSLAQTFPANFGLLTIDASGRVAYQPGEMQVKKNTALNNFAFLMVSATDHLTPKTGLSVTATRSLDGAAFAACANAVTELGNGIYILNLAAADLNASVVTFLFAATGADNRYVTVVTQA